MPLYRGSRRLVLNRRIPVVGGNFSLVYTAGGSAGSGASATTIDYGTLNYVAGNTRVIAIIQWYPGASNTITGVTIGGVALAQVSGAYSLQSSGAPTAVDMWESTGSLAGTSGDVQVTYSAGPNFSQAVALYSLVTTTPTPSDVQVNNSTIGVTSLATPSITIPAGGRAVVGATTVSGETISFTNATLDISVSQGGAVFAFGHTTSTGALVITANWSPADAGVISAAAWGP
jgi:hypothetical protein